jgi:threonine synthase
VPPTSLVVGLMCPACGLVYGESATNQRCRCGGLLDLEVPLPSCSGAELRSRFEARLTGREVADVSGVWRYRELVVPQPPESPISYPEGNTPLIVSDAIARWTGTDRLTLKHEGQNPTGSFKDRGMTVGMTQAVHLGARHVACASTGNTAASLAAYAARAGLPALVLVPAGRVTPEKRAQSAAYGAKTVAVRGDFDRCLELVEQAADHFGLYLLNSVNPYRIAGQQTIILELLHQLRWQPPDWIVFPAGNLGNTSAFGRALITAHRAGLISSLPRLAAVQAEGAAPFAHSFAAGFTSIEPVVADTVATAIRIGNPASFDRAVRAIRATNGLVTTVTDREILEAKAVVDRAGVGCEAASAAAVAGIKRLRLDTVIGENDSVVAVLTGHLLKEPLAAKTARDSRAVEIDGRLEEIEAILDG